ncbi:MAG: hypothetical protein ACI9VM_000577 [Candidatus Azotimanducaceae bacterium]|jgi:uncharacterized protein YkwD
MRSHLKNFFIPHEGNDYRPHSLQKVAVLGMAALVLLSFAFANVQSRVWVQSQWLVSTILPAVIVDLTNIERADASLIQVRRNGSLDQAAQRKAEHMAANQYFAHHSPDGISPWHWFSQVGYNFVHAGENLAIYFTDSDEVMQAWMNSPSHRANIMNDTYTEIGIGTASGMYQGAQTVFVVQLFGTPAAAAPQANADLAAVTPSSQVAFVDDVPSPAPVDTTPLIAGSEEIVTQLDDVEITLSTDKDPVAVLDSPPVQDAEPDEVPDPVYSDFVSTSTGGIPASLDPEQITPSDTQTNPVLSAATQPQRVLGILYLFLGLFVAGVLMLSLVIEIKRHHPVQIAYSAGLMAAMSALFYIQTTLTSGALIV